MWPAPPTKCGPIDSIEQTDFLFGNQEKSNRDSAIIFYGSALLAVKWCKYEIHFSVR
jgi:arylsulfatase